MKDWIEQTKRRHQLCLDWQSEGAVALCVSVPPPFKRDWTRWFENPNVMFEYEMASLENCVAVRSDAVPVLFPNFTAAVVVSLFGADILFHENGPVYEPLITDWAMLDDLELPAMGDGLMPQIESTIDHFRRHAPAYAEIVPPYIHTPLNSAALLRGPGELYADLYLNAESAHRLLGLVTEAAAAAAMHIFEYLGRPATPFVNQAGIWLGDRLHISDDCCVNLSPSFVDEFDLAYVSRLSNLLGAPFCTHYCVLPPNDMAEHCLEPVCACQETVALLNQYDAEYFLEHYAQLENRVALISLGLPPGSRSGKTEEERCRRFSEWAADFLKRFEGKSGLIIKTGAPTVAEARKMVEIWDSLNSWALG